MLIRKAQSLDAEDFCNVLRASITHLCKLDHRDDPKELDSWLENKTVENCAQWIASATSNTFVAEQDGKVVGVAGIGHNGYLYLLYVLPEIKGKGVGQQLLLAAEESVSDIGLDVLRLESTLTARSFYEHCGYHPVSSETDGLMYQKQLN